MTEKKSHMPVLGLTIVQAGFEHVEQIAPMFDAFRQDYGVESNIEGAAAFIDERLYNLQSVIFLAEAQIDGRHQPVGFVQLYPFFSSLSLHRIWVLNDLYVIPEARGQGVATALIDKIRRFAIRSDAGGVVVATLISNHDSRALFESAGFVRDNEFYHYYLHVLEEDKGT